MKKFKLFRAFFLLLAVLSVLSGCAGKKTVEQSGNAYTIYYLNTSGIQLVGSEYRTETTDLDALVRELLDKMGNVPADLDCQRALPERIEKITYRIEGNVLYLYADANYALMNSVQEILCRAALTKTLTQIPDIEYLSIYCAEQPITDAAGNPVGMLSASDFVDSIRDVNSFERTELTLYFANEAGDQLVEEKREVMEAVAYEEVHRHVTEFIHHIQQGQEVDESKLSKSVMEAVKYMRKHYSEPISLESVSAEVHLKTDYLSRIFKEETGMNYSAFLAEIRLKKAAYLLNNTSERVQEIGKAVGYPNVSYFSTTFKKRFGLNPYEFRRKG